jgi:hypothetical protein
MRCKNCDKELSGRCHKVYCNELCKKSFYYKTKPELRDKIKDRVLRKRLKDERNENLKLIEKAEKLQIDSNMLELFKKIYG